MPRFPDRVCLQAFFHPRHTIFEVYKWVYENIKQPALGVGQTEISLEDFYSVFSADQLFELYVSPPKQVFPAIPPSNGGSKYSLADLQLQPAAVLLLSWKENSSLYQQLATTGLITSAAAASASAGNITIGNYLQEGLLAVAEEKGHTRTLGNIKSSSSMNYPVGDSLSSVGNSLAGGVGSLMGSMKSIFGSSKEDAQSDADNKKSAASKKPKWFKI